MTVEQLQAKRDEILQRVGVARSQFGDRSVEYADAAKALGIIDAELASMSAQQSGTATSRTTYATFNNR